ncbi:MAG: hypothetical protein DHS20C02_09020 [Micavibrio sp.]|nr:MAG: hypothetical protein DHS20C02_09020 [Micavibrio sp.]
MTFSPYELMQQAVDIVGDSPHPTNKIAATIAGKDKDGKDFSLSRTNFWPEEIREKIGAETKIGNSSGTVHAETACILSAPVTESAALFVTDPPCPNCMKNIAEARIKTLYIDHKGFDKDWAQRNEDNFEHMSMRIAEHAGISVYEIWRKEEKLVPILEVSKGYAPVIEKPLQLESHEGDISSEVFLEFIKRKDHADEPFAMAFAHDSVGNRYALNATPHPAIGYTSKSMDKPEGKYSFILQPINRLIMSAARYGFQIDADYLYSSRVPTARELVNMVGAGITTIHIGDREDSRDENGPEALKQLQDAETIKVLPCTKV